MFKKKFNSDKLETLPMLGQYNLTNSSDIKKMNDLASSPFRSDSHNQKHWDKLKSQQEMTTK
jgi:hypothetical protein